MIKISLDIDGTLLTDRVHDFVLKHLYNVKGIELWIHTRRYKESEGKEAYELAELFDIPEERVIFCNRNYKAPFLEKNKINLHLDDDSTEIAILPLGSKMNILWIYLPDWEKRCLEYLKYLR